MQQNLKLVSNSETTLYSVVLNYLSKHPKAAFTSADIAEILGLNPGSVHDVLCKAARHGLIEKVPGRKGEQPPRFMATHEVSVEEFAKRTSVKGKRVRSRSRRKPEVAAQPLHITFQINGKATVVTLDEARKMYATLRQVCR